MKKTRKIMNLVSIMVLSLFLMVIGVMAALNQSIDIGGKITTTINNHSGQTRVQVKAYVRNGLEEDYRLYGEKTAWDNAASFIVPDITIEETEPYLTHKLEFINYGEAISLAIEVTAGENFAENFDYYISKSEIYNLAVNTDFNDKMFLQAGLESPKDNELYIHMVLKNSPERNGTFSAYYSIKIGIGIADESTDGYIVQYDANGGTGNMENDIVNPENEYIIRSNDFFKMNMYFMGWSLSNDGDVLYSENSIIIVEEDLTLYAVWRSSTEENMFTYIVEDKEITITSYVGVDMHIVIPESIDGYHVTKISSAEDNNPINNRLISVVLLYGLNEIGDFAFENCGELINVTIPNSVESIGERAFNNCFNLASISIPNSVAYINHSAFRFCGSLRLVYVYRTFSQGIPELGNNIFLYTNVNLKIYVPKNSLEYYLVDTYWSQYSHKIYPLL